LSRATRQNAFLAAVIGVVFGLSPHTSGHRLVPSLVGGVAATAAVFGFREWRARRGRLQAFESSVGRPSLALWACFAVLLAVFASTFAFLYDAWTLSIWNDAHGIFMPLVVAFLAHRTLRRDASDAEESSAWGLAFLALGLGLAVYDAGIKTRFLAALGMVLCLPGLSLLLLGARRTRALALPLGLALFMVPIPIAVASEMAMPLATAALTEPMVELVGIPVLRLKTVFILPTENFAISDACSGVAIFFAALALAIFLAAKTKSPVRRVLLLLAPWPIVVFTSALRCAFLLVFAHFHGMWIVEMATHGLSGIVAFWSVMAILLAIAGPRTLREATL
jgi:exosortase